MEVAAVAEHDFANVIKNTCTEHSLLLTAGSSGPSLTGQEEEKGGGRDKGNLSGSIWRVWTRAEL